MSTECDGMPESLGELLRLGVLRDIDFYLVETILRAYGGSGVPEAAALAMALASRAVGEGHVCLALESITEDFIQSLCPDGETGVVASSSSALRCIKENLVDAKIFAACGAICKTVEPGGSGRNVECGDVTPFVLDNNRLYLRRFYVYEQTVARHLINLAAATQDAVLPAGLEALLVQMLPDVLPQAAARCALTRRLTIITGGPGTGKTYTAARILALLTHQRAGGTRPLRVRLAAPTGKAAARLGESIRQARADMTAGQYQEGIALEDACTLDRLLGTVRGSPYFRHDADNPLDADVVLVDEASMVDLAKMAKLLDALAPHARLVLLGDRHQLAAVQPGSVLAEICDASALQASVVELTKSRRFDAEGEISRFSAAVNGADSPSAADKVCDMLVPSAEGAAAATIRFVEVPRVLMERNGRANSDFAMSVLRGYRTFLDAQTPETVFGALSEFRVLCALRRGPLGVEEVNRVIEKILAMKAINQTDLPQGSELPPKNPLAPTDGFYSHRVILVTQNDYATGLYNGDIGIVLPNPAHALVVYFENSRPAGADDRFRSISCHLLPAHETAFAMTIHKSQGSEFGHVLVLLPGGDSPVLTRELVYTAVTRSRSGVTLWGNRKTIGQAVQRPVRRFTGLLHRLETVCSL